MLSRVHLHNKELDMLAQYFDAHNAHMERAKAQGFKALRFSQFVSLAKHIEVQSAW